MNEDKATRYHRFRRRADVLSAVLAGGVLAWVAVGPGALLRDLALGLAAGTGAGGAAQSRFGLAIFLLMIVGLLELAVLPPAFYRGFLLERRYGLSREPPGVWLRGHLTAAALSLLLVLAGGLLVYELIRIWPAWWWLAAAGGFAAGRLALTVLAPLLLIPLFFRLEPLKRPALHARIASLARRAGTPVLGVYEWRLGWATRRANAALVGLGGTRRILLSDTLLAGYSDDEIEVILAHELAHHVHGDVWKAIGSDAAIAAMSFLGAHVALQALAPGPGLGGPADIAAAPVLLLAGGAAALALSPLGHLLSRCHERRADRYALELTGNAPAFISAMRRLAEQNLAETGPSPLVAALWQAHPPTAERIAVARRWGTPAPEGAGVSGAGR